MKQLPDCFGSARQPQNRAENCCDDCPCESACFENTNMRGILEQWLQTAREHLDTEVAGRTFEVLRRQQ